MPSPNAPDFDGELRVFTLGPERTAWLGDLIASARSDYKPRDFGERHLVDDLAIAKWRGLRVALMEKAVFEQQSTTFRPRNLKDKDGQLVTPHEDIYHLALAYGNSPTASDSHATVLAALNRLDTRYHRQFCTTLRLLIALRRGTPPPVADSRDSVSNQTTGQPQKSNRSKTTSARKETTPCEPSPTTQPTM